MEKFVVIGNSKEKKMTVNLSLPIAKHSKPHVVKKCEEQVYPHDIIAQAMNRKKFESTHIKPLVLKDKTYLELPLNLPSDTPQASLPSCPGTSPAGSKFPN